MECGHVGWIKSRMVIAVNHDGLLARPSRLVYKPGMAKPRQLFGYGERLKAARLKAKLGQEAAQKELGWPDGNSRISQYETEKKEPSLQTFAELAEAYGVA